ncbi:acyl-CoA synthetase, partial [Thermodesulfobacteriota bacterium]
IFENQVKTGLESFNIAAAVNEAALKWGDRVVLYHHDTGDTVTYREADRMSDRVGNALRASGVEIENRIAILMDDCPEWAYTLLGALKIGAVPTPLNTLLTENDYAFFLADSRAKVLFVSDSLFEKIKGIINGLPYLKHIVVHNRDNLTDEAGRVITWESFIKGASEGLEIAPTVPDDLGLFAYTSGTTGRPRAIMLSHRNIFTGVSEFKEVKGVEEGCVQFHIPKLYFLIGSAGLISAFYHGSSMVLLSGRPTPETVFKIFEKYHPNFLVAPPTMLARLMAAAKESPEIADLSSITYINCTGETLSPVLFQRFYETFGKSIYNCWGAQELSSAPLSWKVGEEIPADKVGSVGNRSRAGAVVKIVDEYGKEVPDGDSGEILFKTDGMFLGYWHQPKETAKKIDQGWYRPGDSFMRDKDGYYWYLGRFDDMVKVGGRQVFPPEIEHALARHPAVLENAVAPVQNDLGLFQIHAYVVLKDGYGPSPGLESEIQAFVKDHLAPFKRPHKVEFIKDLPKTATGKIQRSRLKEQAMEKR